MTLKKQKIQLRINRYIVGCKFSPLLATTSLGSELIDTQWDVNDKIGSTYAKIDEELIDTQWDVNDIKAL